MPSYKAMKLAALSQASDLHKRTGKTCSVYLTQEDGKEDVWFVRTADEGPPEHAQCIACVPPDGW